MHSFILAISVVFSSLYVLGNGESTSCTVEAQDQDQSQVLCVATDLLQASHAFHAPVTYVNTPKLIAQLRNVSMPPRKIDHNLRCTKPSRYAIEVFD